MLPETFWGRIQYLLQQYGSSFLSGAGNTMIIAIVGTFLGCLIGFIVGIIQTIPVDKRDSAVKKTLVGFFKFIMACYVEFFRGTPMMVQAMFIYYGSAYLFNINMSMWFAAFFVVSINTGAYMAETVRGGILSVDEGQTEAAKAIGMTHVQTMMNVILPQALRNIMPQIGNQPDHQYQGYLRSFHYWNCRTFLHNKRRSRSLLHLLRILYHRYGNVLYPYFCMLQTAPPAGTQDGRSAEL